MAVGRLRLSAVIPFVCSVVSFALLIVLVTAGTKPGRGSGYYLLTVGCFLLHPEGLLAGDNDVTTGDICLAYVLIHYM